MSTGLNLPPKKVNLGAPRWTVTFADLMSLMLCFFILMLSFSELDRKKYKEVGGSMEKAFGVQRQARIMDSAMGDKLIGKDFDQDIITMRLKVMIGKQIQEEIDSRLGDLKGQLEVGIDGSDVIIRMMGESTFDSGKAEIIEKLKPLLMKIGGILAEAGGDVIVAGHTDNVPVTGGYFKSNLKLSIARAAAVAEFLLLHSKIQPERVSTMGFGEHRPLASNQTGEGRQKNRRVEIIIGTIPKLNESVKKTGG
jgi:chemotaxis protein MotB